MKSVKSAVAPFKVSVLHRGGRCAQEGKVGWLLLWLLGIPVPVLLILFLLRGCT